MLVTHCGGIGGKDIKVADKLTDPSKPAHSLIKVLEDGDAIRNDGVRLTAANKNPWYVLATIYGEGGEHEEPKGHVKDDTLLKYAAEMRAKLRRAWNLWVCLELTDEERAERARTAGLDIAELSPQEDEEKAAAELAEITKLFQARMGKGAKLPSPDKTINFSSTFFPKPLHFGGMVFEKDVSFYLAAFLGSVDFSSTMFTGDADFVDATFTGDADFTGATFADGADFVAAMFMGDAFFRYATFAGYASFRGVMLTGGADFVAATFTGDADFNGTTFMDFAAFNGVTFPMHVSFSGVTYWGDVSFFGATFTGDADFSYAKFKYTTRFANVRFLTSVPQFRAAQLYDNTEFPAHDKDQKSWPPLRGRVKIGEEQFEVMPAVNQKRAYNRLRLLMNGSLRFEEEQFFYRQEMRCKSVLAKWYHKPFYWLYALLSDCGNSVWRPLFWMIFVMLSGALFMLWWQEAFTFLPKESSGFDWTLGLLGEDDLWAKPRQAAGWSISNTLPFLGFGKLYYGGEFAVNLAWPLKVVGGVQTVFGFILLFFFGLGLRNRFRLR